MVEESAGGADVDSCSYWHLVGEVTDIEAWAEASVKEIVVGL